jgi:hypothetical protein
VNGRRSWFWPLNGLFVLLPAVLIFVVVLVRTHPMWSWPYPVWVQTSAHWHQQFTFAGPIAGAMAALWAVRLNGADRIWSQFAAPRVGSGVVVRHLGLLTAWFVGAYVLALLPLTVTTAVKGGIGEPEPLVMASGVLAMAAVTALGYVVGTLVRSLAAVPILAVALYCLDAFAAYGTDTFGAIVPQLYVDPVLGLTESTSLVVFRLALFLTVAAASTTLAATVLRRRATGRYRSPLMQARDVAVYALAPVVLVSTAVVTTPDLFEIEASADERTCTTAQGLEFCVHENNAPRLDGMIEAFEPVLARYGTTPSQFDAIWDHTLLLHQPMSGLPVDGVVVTRLDPDGSVDTMSSGILMTLSGVGLCATPPPPQVEQLQANLYDYLDTGALTGLLSGLRPHQVHAWIDRHNDQLATCSLGEQDVPHT